MAIARAWSRHSRISNFVKEEYYGEEREWLVIYIKELLKKEHFDYLIFGHRHLPLDIFIKPDSRYINLGEWTTFNSYAVFDGKDLELRFFEKPGFAANLVDNSKN